MLKNKMFSRIIPVAAVCLLLCSCGKVKSSRVDGFAMNTTVSVTVYGENADTYSAEILRTVSSLENEISWSVSGSQTAQLNGAKGGEVNAPTVAEILREVLPLCEDTDGEYSLTIRRLCALWGIGTDSARLPSQAEIAGLLPDSECEITLDGDTVSLSSETAQLDFGSVGKGFACDKAARLLSERGADSAVVAVGGSILCFGKKSGGWRIDIAVPGDINSTLGELRFDSDAYVSTSGSEERYFEQDGVKYHHIFSAKTGYPADSGLKSVTVSAKNGLMSDALSTACFIVGYDRAVTLLEKYGADAVFVFDNGDVRVTDGLKNSFTLKNSDYSLK